MSVQQIGVKITLIPGVRPEPTSPGEGEPKSGKFLSPLTPLPHNSTKSQVRLQAGNLAGLLPSPGAFPGELA